MKAVDRLGQAVLSHIVKGIDPSELESDEESSLSTQETQDLEMVGEAFATLRGELLKIHVRSGPDQLTKLHLQQCLARLAEAQMWAERIVLE